MVTGRGHPLKESNLVMTNPVFLSSLASFPRSHSPVSVKVFPFVQVLRGPWRSDIGQFKSIFAQTRKHFTMPRFL